MRCPFCGKDKDKVIDSRASDGGKAIRRRRHCLNCQKRFTTYEHIEESIKLSVIKKDGTRVPYDRAKVVDGIRRACFKRPVPAQAVNTLVDEVEEALFKTGNREVEAFAIGNLVAERLKRLDQVAYVRFASVYKQFRDLDDLLEEVRDIVASEPPRAPGQGNLF